MLFGNRQYIPGHTLDQVIKKNWEYHTNSCEKKKKTKKIIKQWKQHIGVAMMEWKSF